MDEPQKSDLIYLQCSDCWEKAIVWAEAESVPRCECGSFSWEETTPCASLVRGIAADPLTYLETRYIREKFIKSLSEDLIFQKFGCSDDKTGKMT